MFSTENVKDVNVENFFNTSNDTNMVRDIATTFICPNCNQITEKKYINSEIEASIECGNENCDGMAFRVLATCDVLSGIPKNEK